MDLKRILLLTAMICAVLFGSGVYSSEAVSGSGLLDPERIPALAELPAEPVKNEGNASLSNAMFVISAGADGLTKQSQDDGMRFIEPPEILHGGETGPSVSNSGNNGIEDPGFRYVEPPWFLENLDSDFFELTQPEYGKTVTKKPVTFRWSYGNSSDDWDLDVNFELTVTVSRNGSTDEYTFNVPGTSCSKGVCSCKVNSELGSKNATVTWYVTAYVTVDSHVETIISQGSSFNLKFSTPAPTPKPSYRPEEPILKEPSGTLNSRDMGFYWYPSANADYYAIDWWNDRGNSGTLHQNQTDSTCKMNLCIVKTTLPSEGNYSWQVTASNSYGTTVSETWSFRVVSSQLRAPAPYAPSGSITTQSNIPFEWENIESGVTQYRIQVVDKYTGSARLDSWYSVNGMYKGNGVCYQVTDLYLPTGYYSWRVKAKNSTAESQWSAWLDFYVYGAGYVTPSVNTVPTPVYPVSTISEQNPRYEWKAVTGAAYYQLNLYDASGKSLLDVTVPSSYCASGTCSYNPNTALAGNGSYRWIVSAYGSNGSYWGYAEASFMVGVITLQQGIVFITPENNGYLDPNTHKIIWSDPGAGVSTFRIEIKNASGSPMLQADLTRENALCDGISCSIQFRTIPSGKNYKLTVTPYSGTASAGTPAELTFSVQ